MKWDDTGIAVCQYILTCSLAAIRSSSRIVQGHSTDKPSLRTSCRVNLALIFGEHRWRSWNPLGATLSPTLSIIPLSLVGVLLKLSFRFRSHNSRQTLRSAETGLVIRTLRQAALEHAPTV